MSRYFTTKNWIELLRGLPPHGALLHASALHLLSGLDAPAARQATWRLTKSGILTHLGGGWYTHSFAKLTLDEASAVLARPSYISLETVLQRHGVTTQPSAELTCVTTAPTQQRITPLGNIRYRSIARDLYWGFDICFSANGLYLFEAWPEKALLDLVYLSRQGGVWLDLDFRVLDSARLAQCVAGFPPWVERATAALRESRRVTA